MDKNLTVYPISTGDELNVFSTEEIVCIRVMDLTGNVLADSTNINGKQNIISIKHLPGATYIAEVTFRDKRTARSVFVKM